MVQDWIFKTGTVMLLSFNIMVPGVIILKTKGTESPSISQIVHSKKGPRETLLKGETKKTVRNLGV